MLGTEGGAVSESDKYHPVTVLLFQQSSLEAILFLWWGDRGSINILFNTIKIIANGRYFPKY